MLALASSPTTKWAYVEGKRANALALANKTDDQR